MVPQIGKTGLTLATTGYETNGLPSLFVVRSSRGVRGVEFKDRLDGVVWTPLQGVAGTGAVMTVSDLSAIAPIRFYRVRVE